MDHDLKRICEALNNIVEQACRGATRLQRGRQYRIMQEQDEMLEAIRALQEDRR